jgi:hypothetical protein
MIIFIKISLICIFPLKKPAKLIKFPQNLQRISYFSLKCISCSNFSPMCILLICSIYSNSSHSRVLLGSSDTILKADTLGCSIFLFLYSVFWITVCPFSLSYCVVCPSLIYRFWLPLWYLPTLLSLTLIQTGVVVSEVKTFFLS